MKFIFIAFLAPIMYSIANVIESNLVNTSFKRITTMMFYISLMNFLFLPLILFFGMPSIPSMAALPFLIAVSIIDIGYLYPYYKALKKIDVSIVTAMFSLGRIIIPIMGYYMLKEILLPRQYIGFFIIITAAALLSIKDFRMPKINSAFYYMIIASLMFAMYIVLEKDIIIKDGNWINVVIYPKIFSAIVPFAFFFFKPAREDIIASFPKYIKNIKVLTFNEFVCFVAFSVEIFVLSKFSPVIVASITATAPIFALIIGIILYKFIKFEGFENLNRHNITKKIFCFLFMVLGVILTVAN